jgi:hypothetical protein
MKAFLWVTAIVGVLEFVSYLWMSVVGFPQVTSAASRAHSAFYLCFMGVWALVFIIKDKD